MKASLTPMLTAVPESGTNTVIVGHDDVFESATGIYPDPQGMAYVLTPDGNGSRVEVLKGPASVLFGRAEPSGIINFVTKQPLREPYYELSFTAGSYSFYRPSLDFSAPLTEDGDLAYRLNVAYENAGSFRDGVQTERFFIAPTLSWQISDDTELTLEFSYLDDTRPVDRGLVVLSDNQVADIPISRYLGDPEPRENFDETRTELYLNHRFNPNLSLRSALRYSVSTEDGPGATVQIVGPSEDDRNFPVEDFSGYQFLETFTFQNDLIGKFKTGSVEHTALVGVEYYRGFNSFEGGSRGGDTIDIFNPSTDFNFGADEAGVYLHGIHTIFVNPYTGEILGDRNERFSYYRFLLNLHYRLFIPGDTGMYATGVTGLLLFVMAITGILLWPGWRNLKAGFKIKWNAHIKRRNFDLHKVIGIIVAFF